MADESGGTTIVIKKIKKGGHGHHGGAWKVAYADFVTAMMAFFLTMWIMGMDQKTKEGVQKYFNDPLKFMQGAEVVNTGVFTGMDGKQLTAQDKKGGVVDSSKAGGISRVHLLADDLQDGMSNFKPDIQGFKVHPDRIQFAITAQALFSPGSDLLRPESEPLLNKLAQILKSIDASLQIEAHTDDLPPDSPKFDTNWELSSARAAKVVRYFVEGHFFDPSRISAMGAAEYKPVADNRTPEGRAKNRRIDIYVIPTKDKTDSLRSPASEKNP
jgi:chemotaxis protein MotB